MIFKKDFNDKQFIENKTLIISKMNLPKVMSDNINGPSCLRTPNFIKNPVGKYLLYFAHHTGEFIRIAYSEDIFTGWKILDHKINNVSEEKEFHDHVASPDIYVDNIEKSVYMFFHSRIKGSRKQKTFLSKSNDGINFALVKGDLNLPFYFRHVTIETKTFAVTKGGNLYINMVNPIANTWRALNNINTGKSNEEVMHNSSGSIRHASLIYYMKIFIAFYSRIGDSPERIYAAKIVENGKGLWLMSNEFEITRPELNFEGANLDIEASVAGPSLHEENALRDPYVMQDGEDYFLFYACAGESGIAVGKLFMTQIYQRLCA